MKGSSVLLVLRNLQLHFLHFSSRYFKVLNVKIRLVTFNTKAVMLHFMDTETLTTAFERFWSFRDANQKSYK